MTGSRAAPQAVLDAAPKQLYIGGRWRDAAGGETLAVEDPATGETIARVADATPQDALDALGAAHDAQRGEWRESAPRERSDILRRAYEAIVARTDELALLMTLEMGKPLAESRPRSPTARAFCAGTPRRRCAPTAASRRTRPARGGC